MIPNIHELHPFKFRSVTRSGSQSPGLQIERALFAADGERVRDVLLDVCLNLEAMWKNHHVRIIRGHKNKRAAERTSRTSIPAMSIRSLTLNFCPISLSLGTQYSTMLLNCGNINMNISIIVLCTHHLSRLFPLQNIKGEVYQNVENAALFHSIKVISIIVYRIERLFIWLREHHWCQSWSWRSISEPIYRFCYGSFSPFFNLIAAQLWIN